MRFFRTSPEKLPAAESEMIFSKQDLKQLLLPLLAEQFLVVLIGMMDTIMVSYCGMKAMSGVSLVDGINVLLIGVFSALATGGAVLVSQYLGKKRPDAAKTAAKMLFYVVLLVSLAIMAICLIFRKPLLLTLFGNVEDEVMAASQAYFLMSALSYPVMAIYNAYCALLRCIGNPRATMFSSLIMNIVNLVGNAVTIYLLGWGVVGAGLIHQELSCEFIGDGVHTNPKLITLLMQSKPIDKLVMITDALKYAHATPPEDADFYFDKCFKRKADEVIIGSGITMYDGFRNLLEFGVRVEDAVKMTSVNPAEIMKQNGKGMIIPGFDADLLIMDKDFNLIDTVVGGKFIREKK